jgi:two-component system, NtrC family, response regulator PilR
VDRILVVDDELSMREFLEILFAKDGYEVAVAANGEQAVNLLRAQSFDLILTDIMMPKLGGIELLAEAKRLDPQCQVIMITAFGSTENAVEAMKLGAYDYITKPFQVDEIKLTVAKALEKNRLLKENFRLQKEVRSKYVFENIVGSSLPMRQLFDLIHNVAPTKANILILGESGTGKELVARAIHYNSPRSDKPFVTVNCGAIPADLLETELFGHRKGSFTGAYADKRGLFEVAHQGTMFLDEIGEAPLAIQVKLLRAIQDKTFKAVGGLEDVVVDVRVIAASNRDLEEAVRARQFREDLYYRLNVIRVSIPPLRERKEDIPLLVQHFLQRYAAEIGKDLQGINPEADRLLINYDWPGNVRELENTIERAVSLCQAAVIGPDSLPDRVRGGAAVCGPVPATSIPEHGLDLEAVLQGIERKFIEEALARSGGVKKRAARLLGISFRSFRYRLEKLGLDTGKDDDE